MGNIPTKKIPVKRRVMEHWKDDLRWHCKDRNGDMEDVKGAELSVNHDINGNEYIICPVCLMHIYKNGAQH
jgi:hypothetical protein